MLVEDDEVKILWGYFLSLNEVLKVVAMVVVLAVMVAGLAKMKGLVIWLVFVNIK